MVVFIHQLLDGEGPVYVKNAAEVRRILQESGKVLAVFQGHHHEGAYSRIDGIHYYTLKAVIEGHGQENNSYAIVELPRDRDLIVTGYRKATSIELSYVSKASVEPSPILRLTMPPGPLTLSLQLPCGLARESSAVAAVWRRWRRGSRWRRPLPCDDGRLAAAVGGLVLQVENVRLDLRQRGEARQLVRVEIAVEDHAALEVDVLGQRVAQTHRDAAFHLDRGALGIDRQAHVLGAGRPA